MPDDLEQLIGDRLRRLPSRRAPQSLRPRVMAAVAARRRRPAANPWFQWPWPHQAALVAALLLGVAGGAWLVSQAPMPSLEVGGGWGSGVLQARQMLFGAGAAFQAAAVFIRALLSQPMVIGFAAVVMLMSAACGGFAMMLGRVAAASTQGAE